MADIIGGTDSIGVGSGQQLWLTTQGTTLCYVYRVDSLSLSVLESFRLILEVMIPRRITQHQLYSSVHMSRLQTLTATVRFSCVLYDTVLYCALGEL